MDALKNKTEKYSAFRFADFVNDSDFIGWALRPAPETDRFWEDFMSSHPELRSEIISARDFVLSAKIALTTSELSPGEREEIWAGIQAANDYADRAARKRKFPLRGIGIAAAAVAALIIATPLVFNSLRDKTPDIVAFANAGTTVVGSGGATKLILSDDNIVDIEQKDAEITYNPEEITAAGKTIPRDNAAPFNQIITPKGKRTTLVFDDGTKVWINGGAKVVYPVEFAANRREIFVDGEIFLDVTPDKHRPFVVRTNEASVRVLGTRFNVSAYSDDDNLRVTLVSGAVKVSPTVAKHDFLLEPNQMFVSSPEGGSVIDVDVALYISWIDGIYIYDNETLAVVAAQLSRYYGVEIVCGGDAGDLRFSGKLDLKDNIGDILNGIAYSAGIKLNTGEDTYLLYR